MLKRIRSKGLELKESEKKEIAKYDGVPYVPPEDQLENTEAT